MIRRDRCALMLCPLVLCTAGVNAQTFYSQNFQYGETFAGWSTSDYRNQSPFSRFLGRFNNETVTFDHVLPGLPSVGSWEYVLAFDLYVIDTWDGSEPQYGGDHLKLMIDGTRIFDETFANVHDIQTFREPDVGRAPMAFGAGADSIYRIQVPFVADAGLTRFAWQAYGLQSMGDESWGLDNVRLSMRSVPAPGAAAVVVGAGLIGMRRRRRVD